MTKKGRKFKSEDKVRILKRHLLEVMGSEVMGSDANVTSLRDELC